MAAHNGQAGALSPQQQAQIQPCRYKTGKTLGAGSYSVVKECVHIDTGRYYAAKVINKRLMAGREHMVRPSSYASPMESYFRLGSQRNCCPQTSVHGSSEYPHS